MARQTVKVKYHLILNNPVLHDEHTRLITETGYDFVNIIYRHNEKKIFERHQYIKDYLANDNDFVIIMDDDQYIHEKQIEILWNLRQKKTMVGWYGRRFYPSELYVSQIDAVKCLNDLDPDFKEFSYCGPGFSVVDTEIYRLADNPYFALEQSHIRDTLYIIDDIPLSWALNKLGWTLKRSFNRPEMLLDDEHHTYTQLAPGLKSRFATEMHNMHPFRLFEK